MLDARFVSLALELNLVGMALCMAMVFSGGSGRRWFLVGLVGGLNAGISPVLPDRFRRCCRSWRSCSTSGQNSVLELALLAKDVYLDVGGTGTITATVIGQTTACPVSGAPHLSTVVHSGKQGQGTVRLTLSGQQAAPRTR